MIELIILNALKDKLSVNVEMERPEPIEDTFVLIEKTSSGKRNHLPSSTFAFQSYSSNSLYEAVKLNELVKKAVEELIELNEIVSVNLNSDYNFTDTTTKQYRYQAVFDIKHY